MVSEQNDIEIIYRLTKDIKQGQEMLLYYPGVEKRINLGMCCEYIVISSRCIIYFAIDYNKFGFLPIKNLKLC